MPDPYDALAGLYDAELALFDADLSYWHSRARGRVLDLGCGTGRVAAYLRAKGREVTGLDASRRMLEKARRNAPGVPFLQADLRWFSLRNFGSAFAAWSSFQFLLTRDDRARALACIRDALLPDGYLTIDLFAPMPKAPAISARKVAAQFAWEGKRVTKFESARRAAGILDLRWEYFAEGAPVADVTQRVAIIDRPMIEAELEAAGFAVFALFRDWRENRFEERGPRLIVEAARV